jgi:hypothetical protein
MGGWSVTPTEKAGLASAVGSKAPPATLAPACSKLRRETPHKSDRRFPLFDILCPPCGFYRRYRNSRPILLAGDRRLFVLPASHVRVVTTTIEFPVNSTLVDGPARSIIPGKVPAYLIKIIDSN